MSPLFTSVRFLISCLLFFAIIVQFTHKTGNLILFLKLFFTPIQTYLFVFIYELDISIGLVCMVNHTAIDKNISSSYSNLNADNCIVKNSSSNSTKKDGPFLWTKTDQGVISSSYFAGYFLSQIPGKHCFTYMLKL